MSTMKSTETVLAMIEETKNAMFSKAKTRGISKEEVHVMFDCWGGGCTWAFGHYENGKDYENWDEVFRLTQEQGYYITKISLADGYDCDFRVGVRIKRSKDCFTTNVDADVLEALKNLTTLMIGKKNTKENEIAKEAWAMKCGERHFRNKISQSIGVRDHGMGWWVLIDEHGRRDYLGYGFIGGAKMWRELHKIMPCYYIKDCRMRESGYVAIHIGALIHHNEGNINTSLLDNVLLPRLERLAA